MREPIKTMLELTVSGVMRTKAGSDVDAHAFAGVKIKIPASPEEYHKTHARRMFPMVARENKDLNKHVYEGVIKLYVDDVKECAGEPACMDKDIKEMDWLELQHLACCLLVREIPHYLTSDIRTAREKAYETYMKVIKKMKVIKSGKDKKIIEEKVRRKYEQELNNGDITSLEIDSKVQEALNKCFNMMVDSNNLANSYSFAKLPPLVPVKSDKKNKVD